MYLYFILPFKMFDFDYIKNNYFIFCLIRGRDTSERETSQRTIHMIDKLKSKLLLCTAYLLLYTCTCTSSRMKAWCTSLLSAGDMPPW